MQPAENAQLEQSTQPEQPIKRKRGRPPRKTVDPFATPETGIKPECSTPFYEKSDFETPVSGQPEFATPISEKPRRGRKKKDPNAVTTPFPVNPSPVYESVPGKRNRKKIDYRELNGDKDHSNATLQSDPQAIPLEGKIPPFFIQRYLTIGLLPLPPLHTHNH